MQRFINAFIFFILSLLVALGVFNYTANQAQEEAFRNKGLRFTYCDGLFIYRELHQGIPDDIRCANETNTDFMKYIEGLKK